jgi:hypothetical protein
LSDKALFLLGFIVSARHVLRHVSICQFSMSSHICGEEISHDTGAATDNSATAFCASFLEFPHGN